MSQSAIEQRVGVTLSGEEALALVECVLFVDETDIQIRNWARSGASKIVAAASAQGLDVSRLSREPQRPVPPARTRAADL